jgi:hypothetical protein
VRPTAPVDDVSDGHRADPELTSEANLFASLSGVPRPDLSNPLGRQLMGTIPLSTRISPVANAISGILFLGPPPEVHEPVVTVTAGTVEPLHPFRAWTLESFEYETMDFASSVQIAPVE